MSDRGFLWHFFLYLLPLLVVTMGIEGYLLARWGEKRGEFGFVVKVPVAMAAKYALAYLVMLLVAVFVSSKFLTLASESFNVRASYLQAFTLLAYGFGPIILVRVLDGIPQLNTWVCWAIGAVVSVSVLYHGIGMILKPEQTKGFGLYLVTIVILVITSALAHFAALSVLHGKVLRPRAEHTQAVVSLAPPSIRLAWIGNSW